MDPCATLLNGTSLRPHSILFFMTIKTKETNLLSFFLFVCLFFFDDQSELRGCTEKVIRWIGRSFSLSVPGFLDDAGVRIRVVGEEVEDECGRKEFSWSRLHNALEIRFSRRQPLQDEGALFVVVCLGSLDSWKRSSERRKETTKEEEKKKKKKWTCFDGFEED